METPPPPPPQDWVHSTDAGPEQSPPPRPAPSRRWATLLAWLVILTLTVGVAAIQAGVGLRPRKAADPSASATEGQAQAQLQSRIMVGLDQITPIDQQLDQLNTGPLAQRFTFIVLSGEAVGPDKAIDHLTRLLKRPEDYGAEKLSDKDQRLAEALLKLYRQFENDNFDSDALPEDDRQTIKDGLGWVGELALTPRKSPHKDRRESLMADARTAAFAYIAILMAGGCLAIVGVGVLIALAIFLFTGRWPPRFDTNPDHGGVYAETFAIWMVVLVGLMVLGGLAAVWLDRYAREAGYPQLGEAGKVVGSLLMILSFLSLTWPVCRGIPFHQVRRDIGLHTGTALWKEVLAGLVGYLVTIPWGIAGIALTIFLMHLQRQGLLPGGETQPTHPIVDELAKRDWLIIVQSLFLASIMAPLLEETMFRGVLYTHLRTATQSWGRLLSFLASATVSGVIFAAIHPQGWVAIPALAGLACGFAFTREWRGSLVPSMVGHGLHNGMLLMVFLLAMG